MLHYLNLLSSLINKGSSGKKKEVTLHICLLWESNFSVVLLKRSWNILQIVLKALYFQLNFPLIQVLKKKKKCLSLVQSNLTCEEMWWKEGQGRKETAVLTNCGLNILKFFKSCKTMWPCEHKARDLPRALEGVLCKEGALKPKPPSI